MGQLSRMSRADRFIETFSSLYLKSNGLGIGKTFTVVDEGLGMNDWDETVHHYVTFQDENGKRFDVIVEGTRLYDPEDDADVEALSEQLEVDEDQVKDMLKKADLE